LQPKENYSIKLICCCCFNEGTGKCILKVLNGKHAQLQEMFPPIAGGGSPSRNNSFDHSGTPARKVYERPSTKTPEVFKGFASSRSSFSNLTLRTPAACGFEIPVAEPFTAADDILNGFTRPSFLTRLENRRSASVENMLAHSERTTTKLKLHRVKKSHEFALEAQQLIAYIKDARALKSTFISNSASESAQEVAETTDKSLPSIQDLNKLNAKPSFKRRPSRAERVNEKLDIYRCDPEAREMLMQRNLDSKIVFAREILDRNIGFVRSLSPEVKLERIAQQASKATEHRDGVLRNYTEIHEKLHLHWLNEPHNRIVRLKEEAKRAKMAHYLQVFHAFYRTVNSVLIVTETLQLIRTSRIRKNAELGILNWIRRWKVKKRVRSAIIIQRCHAAFHMRRQTLHKSAEIVKFVLRNSKIAIMAKNALDRMRGRMGEVRAHWRLNKAIRWFKYRIILYQLTMYDSERLRRVRESGKTHQVVLKEKAVSSVSAIIKGSGVQSGVNQLQSFVTTLSHASGFIAAGLRSVMLYLRHMVLSKFRLRNPKSISNLPVYAYEQVLMDCKTFKSLKKDAFEFAYYSSEIAERHITL
jgi:hypothetical protein